MATFFFVLVKNKLFFPLWYKWIVALFLLCSVDLFVSCSASSHPQRDEIMNLVKGLSKDDTSYVYDLPFEKGKTYRIIQGYFGMFTHRNRAALDFNMKQGHKVCAAREGVVIRMKKDGQKGGFNKKYREEGNHVIIEHTDGSRAGYWHLQYNSVLVNVGDSIEKYQVIGLSGKTGYTATPHLHFIVWRREKNDWKQVATRFRTANGIAYLKNWKKYTN